MAAERYKIINENNNLLFNNNIPLLIQKHRLLTDTKKGCNVLQILLKNLGKENIVAVSIQIICHDSMSDETSTQEYTYLDLDISAYKTFGSDTPIVLNSDKVRKFSFIINKILFADGSSSGDTNVLQKIPPAKNLSTLGAYKSQYEKEIKKINSNMVVKNALDIRDNYWICPCGEINLLHTEHCSGCKLAKSNLIKMSDTEFLKIQEAKDHQEQLAREQEQRKQAEIASSKKKRTIKICVAIGLVATIIIGSIEGINYYKNTYLPQKNYDVACQLYENGDLESAKVAFENLNGFQDSTDFIAKINNEIEESKKAELYDKIIALGEAKQYDDAIELLDQLGTYKDSLRLRKEFLFYKEYDKVCELIKKNDYKDAATVATDYLEKYRSTTGFQNLQKMIEQCNIAYYELGNSEFDKGNFDTALEYYNQCEKMPESTDKINKIQNMLKKQYQDVIGAYYKLGNSKDCGNYGVYIIFFWENGQLYCETSWNPGWTVDDIKNSINSMATSKGWKGEGQYSSLVTKGNDDTYTVTSTGNKTLMKCHISNHHLEVLETPLENVYDSWKTHKGTYTFMPDITIL